MHASDSLGIGIIEKYVGRYWMFNNYKYQYSEVLDTGVPLNYFFEVAGKVVNGRCFPQPHSRVLRVLSITYGNIRSQFRSSFLPSGHD